MNTTMTQAAIDVMAERQRQINVEGWTPEHDRQEHRSGQLAAAALCYTFNAFGWLQDPGIPRDDYAGLSPVNRMWWPWSEKWWKPKSVRGDLVKATALLLAQIESIDCAALAQKAQQ